MRTSIQRILGSIQPWLASMPRYAVIGARFFAIASAIPLLWLMIEGHGSDGSSRVFGTTVDGAVHSVWGLTYSGVLGSIVLWLELIALIAAMVMTMLPGSVSLVGQHIVTRMRRIGHGYLTGWAALWMFGAMSLAAIDPGFWTLQAIFLMALFGCTVYRSWREWSPRDRDLNSVEPHDQEPIVNHQQFAAAQPASYPSPSVGVVAHTPHTDIADVSRFMLNRSAVRPSDRLKEIDSVRQAPSRQFSAANPVDYNEEPDDYGATLRSAAANAVDLARTYGSMAWGFARRCTAAIGSTVKRTLTLSLPGRGSS